MRRLLYVSALSKGVSPSGKVMRSEMILSALRGVYQVSLATPEAAPPAGEAFDVVHVFRLAALPLAAPYLSAAGERHLDLDDIESQTHKRIAAIARCNGHDDLAASAKAEARRFEMLEITAVRKFDRVYVCSEADRASLAERWTPTWTNRSMAELRVLPNVVRLPDPPLDSPRSSALPSVGEPFRFLFLGMMDYYPNFDGYYWFCREILPILRLRAPAKFVVEVAGPGSATRLNPCESVHLTGEVPDVRPAYERADAVIVPLRAGGGTRIKILEAFSFGRPVVSTTMGAEGIDATPDSDILLADTPESFAACCVQLMSDPDLGTRLASNAFRLVEKNYSGSVLRSVIESYSEAQVAEGQRS